MGPADGGAQGAVATGPGGLVGEEVEAGGAGGRGRPGAAREPGRAGGAVRRGGAARSVEAGADAGGELGHAVPSDARGGQFDGERDAFETAADLGGGRLVPGGVETGPGVGGAQPVGEELEGVGRAVHRERRHLDDVLAAGAERLPAGDEDAQPGRGRQDLGQQVGAGAAEVFGRVEDQQEALVAEPFTERLDGHPQGVVGEPDRVRDGGEQQPVVGERGEVGPPGAVRVSV